jgi:prepilin signal peptidase PulO-like enzyme (type II secretory pathway)
LAGFKVQFARIRIGSVAYGTQAELLVMEKVINEIKFTPPLITGTVCAGLFVVWREKLMMNGSSRT